MLSLDEHYNVWLASNLECCIDSHFNKCAQWNMNNNITFLPCNLSLSPAMSGHFWSRGHTVRSARVENQILQADFIALCFIELRLLPIEVLHCGNSDFGPFLLLWPWPWPNDLYIRTWPVFPRDITDVRIWTSYVKGFPKSSSDRHADRQTDRQTDRQDRSYIPRRFAGDQ